MLISEMTDEEFKQHALSILQRELGVEGWVRFMRLYRSGQGDYTRDRSGWLDGLSVDDILNEKLAGPS